MQVIGIAGKARAGKDTCGDYLRDNYAFKKYALAGPLKRMLEAGLGLPEAMYQTPEAKEKTIPWIGKSYRALAQSIGTEWGRAQHPELWLQLAEQFRISLSLSDSPGMVITDLRFENEAAWVRRVGGTIIHVQRDIDNGLSAEAKAHASEAGVSLVNGDHLLFNFGSIAQLHMTIDGTMRAIWDRK